MWPAKGFWKTNVAHEPKRLSTTGIGYWLQRRVSCHQCSSKKILNWACLFCCARSACNCKTMQTHKQWSVPNVERAMRYVHTVLNSECWKCARIKFHCTNCLVVLCNCAVAAPYREHCLSHISATSAERLLSHANAQLPALTFRAVNLTKTLRQVQGIFCNNVWEVAYKITNVEPARKALPRRVRWTG